MGKECRSARRKELYFLSNLNLLITELESVMTTLTAEAFVGRDFRNQAIVLWNLLAGKQ